MLTDGRRARRFTVRRPHLDRARPARYQINRFSEAITAGGELGGDVNRDGDTTDTFGVLYDPATARHLGRHRTTTGDFTDDAGDAAVQGRSYEVGHFGTDNPATAVVERMPFVVEYREDVDDHAGRPGPATADFVNIGIIEAEHGTHVAGITAAQRPVRRRR